MHMYTWVNLIKTTPYTPSLSMGSTLADLINGQLKMFEKIIVSALNMFGPFFPYYY